MPSMGRRSFLKRLAAVTIGTAAAGVSVQILMPQTHAAEDVERFDEVYKGRRIKGVGVPRTSAGASTQEPQLSIDGVDLHVMTNADGTYVTALNHYQSFPTLREAAQAAVDDLAGAALRPMPHHV
jgi:Tyrosinase co-factor MelC1